MADAEPPKHAKRSRRRDDPKMIGFWKLGKTIGKGSSGRVKVARHIKTGEYAAVKIVSKQALITSRMSMAGVSEQADKILLSIEREIVIMKLIDHPNVLRLYDVWETTTELYLILEYVQNGELFDYLVSKGRLSLTEALQYFQQIISAVDYCHRFNVAHRDLKPENLLLDHENNIKVADFGMAAWEGGASMLETSCGSPHYASPEVVQGKAYKGCTSDIWSCGVILYALLVGRLPFDDDNIRKLLEKVKHGKYVMPKDIPLAAQHLLSRMLEKDVDKRIKMSEILVHPWFTSHPMKPLPGNVIAPTTLDTTCRPVHSASEIDVDILSNLRTLWHGATDEQIIAGLLNEENTWEKAVYYLLLQYRARRLEDYDQEEGKPPQVPPKDSTPTSATGRKPPGNASRLPTTTTVDILGNNEIGQNGKQHQAPVRGKAPAGPRTPAKPSETTSTTGTKSKDPSKPVEPGVSVEIKLESPVSRLKPTETPQKILSAPPVVATGSGETMQQFLTQLAKHVNNNSPKEIQTSPKQSMPISFPRASTISSDDDRFADAEEDDTIAPYSVSMTGSIRTTVTTDASSSGSSSPGIETYGLGISSYSQNQHQIYPPTSNGTAHRDRVKPVFPMTFRHSVNTNLPVTLPGRLPISTLVTSPPVPPKKGPQVAAYTRSGDTSSDKENTQRTDLIAGRPRVGTVAPQSSLRGNKTGLERRRTLGDRHVQIVLPGEEATLRKKKSLSVISSSSEHSSFSAQPSVSTEKATWFGNLFKFKPASFHLLSVYDAIESRDECRRILMNMGVLVTVENTGNLFCRFDGVTDPAGVMQGLKAVRFRVEFHSVVGTHVVAGFTTSVSMIQEKGALSSFKLLYNRLRREWSFDAPPPILKTPATPGPRWSNRRSCDI